jgi:diguanylate cyclase (GGDEF)-like protein
MENIHILLVEDDEDDFLIITDLLSESNKYNYSFDWARTYSDAMDLLSKRVFDISILDFRLGEKNGLEILSEIKSVYKDLPVILLTGIGDTQVDLAAMEIGAADFLMKGQIDTKILERSIRYTLEHNQQINQLNELSNHDQLTGLLNRREMDRILKEEFERQNRYGQTFSLVMLDIDHFKKVNDIFGHLIGDMVLKWLADIIKSRIRTSDRPIRYGGEEFAIILPETKKEDGVFVAEWLRKTVAETPFAGKVLNVPEEEIYITISLGIADSTGSVKTQQSLVNAADQALYAAKKAGRNIVIVSDEKNNENPANHRRKTYPPPGREKNQANVDNKQTN